ncbi:MAG: rhodanese-like domain-containing protein [Phycisphaerales bacterium JB040]
MVTLTQQNDIRVTDVSPAHLSDWLGSADTLLVDVREDFEHAEEHIEGSELFPLSRFDPERVRALAHGRRVVFHCRSGKRSRDAAERYARAVPAPGETAYHLAGGIEAWKAAGRPCVRPETAPRIGVMRQVQITAGFLVTLGVVLGLVASPWFLAISAFVGCGLMFAGLSGWCGMAMLLGRMPWNRRGAPKPKPAPCCAQS